MGHGSQQLRVFRSAIRDGATLEEACAATGYDGISPAEGRIHLANDLKSPPPPEAFIPIGPSRKEPDMARTARPKTEESVEEVQTKDFAGAVKIYRQDIKSAASKQGEYGQELSSAYKAIKKNCHIQPQAAKLAFKLDAMEEAHRDDFLRCFNGLCKELNIFMPVDMVDMAEGKGGSQESVVPSGSRPKPKLVTLEMGIPSDGSETDLAEAGEDELAAQEGRPAPGTGDAAIEAMNEAAE